MSFALLVFDCGLPLTFGLAILYIAMQADHEQFR